LVSRRSIETWCVLPPSPAGEAAHENVRVVRSDDRPPPSCWLDGPLATLGSPLVLRVLLDRSRRVMFVTCPPASRRSLFPRTIATLRCRPLPCSVSPAQSRCGTFQRATSPTALPARKTHYRRACHHPATVGTSRVSHPLRAFTVSRAPRACFIPDAPMGFRPSGPSPFAEPQCLSAPVAFLTFAKRFPRPTVRRSTRPRAPRRPATRTLRHGGPSASGADRERTCVASYARSLPTIPHGVDPFGSGSLLSTRPEVPDAGRRLVRLQGFSLCKEHGPLGRLLGRDRGRCPPGLHLSRALSRVSSVDLSRSPHPLGLSRPRPRPKPWNNRSSLRVPPHAPGRSSREARRPS
jgi:hypothetical protein